MTTGENSRTNGSLTSGAEGIAAASGLDQDWQHVDVPTGLSEVLQPPPVPPAQMCSSESAPLDGQHGSGANDAAAAPSLASALQGHVVATVKAVYATVAHGIFSHDKQFEHQQQLERETAAAEERALARERRQLQKAAAIMAMLEGALLQHQLHQIATVNKGLAEMWRRQQQQQMQQQLQHERVRAEGLAAELVQERERHQQQVQELQAQHELAQAAAVAAALADERQRHQLLLRDAAMAGLSPMAAQLQFALQQAQEQHQQELKAVAAAAEAQHLSITQELDDLRQQHQSLHDEDTWYRVRRQVTDMSLIKGPAPAAGVPAEAKARSVLVTVPRFADQQQRVMQLLAGMAVLDQKMISCERVDNGGPADAPLGTWRVKLASGMLCRRLQAYTGTVKAHCEELGSLWVRGGSAPQPRVPM
eukprot:TRINITY_DN886_c1_g1_i1.p1 TRINITY_DN886_c1_g1~~TRINITY_DN886_c1_g1_i1.p1  ORF type:complete len:438 (+),score=157.36 TRINITY_DN886_c1_g1_i1:55-1314(+)